VPQNSGPATIREIILSEYLTGKEGNA